MDSKYNSVRVALSLGSCMREHAEIELAIELVTVDDVCFFPKLNSFRVTPWCLLTPSAWFLRYADINPKFFGSLSIKMAWLVISNSKLASARTTWSISTEFCCTVDLNVWKFLPPTLRVITPSPDPWRCITGALFAVVVVAGREVPFALAEDDNWRQWYCATDGIRRIIVVNWWLLQFV